MIEGKAKRNPKHVSIPYLKFVEISHLKFFEETHQKKNLQYKIDPHKRGKSI